MIEYLVLFIFRNLNMFPSNEPARREQKQCSKGLTKYKRGDFHLLWRKGDIRGILKRDVLDQAVLTTVISDLKKKKSK